MLNHLIRPWEQPNVVKRMFYYITRCRGCRRPWLLTYGRWMNLKGEISKPEGHSTVLRKKERRELSRIQQQLLSHSFLVIVVHFHGTIRIPIYILRFKSLSNQHLFKYLNVIKSILYNKIMNSQHNILVLISHQ